MRHENGGKRMRRKISLRLIIILLVLIPSILTGVSSILVMSNMVVGYSEKQIRNELRASGIAAVQAYDMADNSDYERLSDGTVKKGDLVISNNFELIDNFKNKTGLEATFFYGDERIITTLVDESGNRLIGSIADKDIVNKVINEGKDYYSADVMINNVRYCGYYLPVKQVSTNECVGMYFIGDRYDYVMNELDRTGNFSDFLPVILVIIIGSGIAIVFAVYVVSRLKRSVKQLESIANGNLTVKTDDKLMKDMTEIGELGRTSEYLRKSIKNIINEIAKTDEVMSETITHTQNNSKVTMEVTRDVEHAMNQIAESSAMQAKNTEQAAMSVSKIGDLIEVSTQQIETLLDSSKRMNKIQEDVVESLHKLQNVNQQSQEAIKKIYEQTNVTNNSVQEIRKAANFITDIAEETNLLSLNAAIEAARAGENGKGFAVVAAQIQKLAEQSNESAKQITEVISILINDSNKSVESMIEVNSVMEDQTKNVENTKEMFNEVACSIKENDSLCYQIHDSMQQLDSYRSSIIDVVSNLSALSEENAASIEETASACENLKGTAKHSLVEVEKMQKISVDLTEQINAFKLHKDK